MQKEEVISYFKQRQNTKRKKDIADELRSKGVSNAIISDAIKDVYDKPTKDDHSDSDYLYWALFAVSFFIGLGVIGAPSKFWHFILLIVFAGWLTAPLFVEKEADSKKRILTWVVWVVVQLIIYYLALEPRTGIGVPHYN